MKISLINTSPVFLYAIIIVMSSCMVILYVVQMNCILLLRNWYLYQQELCLIKDASLLHDELRFEYEWDGCHQHYLGERNLAKQKIRYFLFEKNVFNWQQ